MKKQCEGCHAAVTNHPLNIGNTTCNTGHAFQECQAAPSHLMENSGGRHITKEMWRDWDRTVLLFRMD